MKIKITNLSHTAGAEWTQVEAVINDSLNVYALKRVDSGADNALFGTTFDEYEIEGVFHYSKDAGFSEYSPEFEDLIADSAKYIAANA